MGSSQAFMQEGLYVSYFGLWQEAWWCGRTLCRGAEAWVLVYAVLLLVSVLESVKQVWASEPTVSLGHFLPHSRCSANTCSHCGKTTL